MFSVWCKRIRFEATLLKQQLYGGGEGRKRKNTSKPSLQFPFSTITTTAYPSLWRVPGRALTAASRALGTPLAAPAAESGSHFTLTKQEWGAQRLGFLPPLCGTSHDPLHI